MRAGRQTPCLPARFILASEPRPSSPPKESPMAESRFAHVTYIRTTPEKLCQALTDPQFTRKYWVETWQDCAWKKGATWKLMTPDGRVADSGEVFEIDPSRKLVVTWQRHLTPGVAAEGHSRMTYTLEPQ